MLDLLKVLHLETYDRPIIVSPSMSGVFALPLLFQQPEAFSGYVPVAPVGVEDYTAERYKVNQVPYELLLIINYLMKKGVVNP